MPGTENTKINKTDMVSFPPQCIILWERLKQSKQGQDMPKGLERRLAQVIKSFGGHWKKRYFTLISVQTH